jgi:thiamine transport system permease protein
LLVLGVFFVVPVAGMVQRGFTVGGVADPLGVWAVLARPRIHRVLWFTLWSASAGTALSLVLGLPASYVVHRLDLPGRRLVRAFLLVPFVLPSVVVGIAFRQLFSGPLAALHLDGSSFGIVLALAFFNIAVVVRTVGASWESLDRRPGEAAAALGASPARCFGP